MCKSSCFFFVRVDYHPVIFKKKREEHPEYLFNHKTNKKQKKLSVNRQHNAYMVGERQSAQLQNVSFRK